MEMPSKELLNVREIVTECSCVRKQIVRIARSDVKSVLAVGQILKSLAVRG